MFYKNNPYINKLLYEQVKVYLEQDLYKYINASNLVKNNVDIATFVVQIDYKFIHYVGEDIRSLF